MSNIITSHAKLFWEDFPFELNVSSIGDIYFYNLNGKKIITKTALVERADKRYVTMSFISNGIKYNCFNVAKIIYYAFHQDENQNKHIMYVDDDPSNIRLENLYTSNVDSYLGDEEEIERLKYPNRTKCKLCCAKYPCMFNSKGEPANFRWIFSAIGCKNIQLINGYK